MNIVLVTIGVYLAFILSIAWYFSKNESLEGYLLNDRNSGPWLLALATFSSMVGAGAVLAVISEVYNTGISWGIALTCSFFLGALVFAFMSKYIRQTGEKYGARTLVDFFEKRFDDKNKYLVMFGQLFMLVFWIAIQAVAIASLASLVTGIDRNVAIILTALITIVYTTIGGLKIDLISDFIQFWIIIVTFIAMAIIGYLEIGSFSNLFAQLPAGHLDPFAFGGASWFLGVILLSGFMDLGSTSHWQRILSAKDEKVARKSYLLLAPMIFVFSLVILFLGLLSVVLITGIHQDQAAFAIMQHLLPEPLIGIGFAAILAVVMSSIDSLLIAGSTILFDNSSSSKIVHARLLTLFFGLFGFLVAYFVPSLITLSLFVAYFVLIFVPPIFGGFFSKKFSSKASFYSLLIPMILLVSLFVYLGEDTFLVSTPVGITIAVFYDKVFKKR